MSQEEIYKILEELGGEATSGQISRRAKEKYPNLSLYMYVARRLQRLELYGVVKSEDKNRKTLWKIIDKYK